VETKRKMTKKEKKDKEKGSVSRPKFKGRGNLARQSVDGTKKVPMRGQTLVLSLCIFNAFSTNIHAIFIPFIRDSPNVTYHLV